MTVQEYLNLPYTIVIRHLTDENGSYYFATVLELAGCMSDGETREDAFAGIQEAMRGWVETKLAHGLPVPLPEDTNRYSGRFMVRLPKTLHARIALAAKLEGVSLNQYAVHKLSAMA
jgi:predicted RNase H-like HicB family nuclease